MTQPEFLTDWYDPATLKIVALDPAGRAIGYLTVHLSLKRVSWVPQEPLLAFQRLRNRSGCPVYIGSFVVDPDLRASSVAHRLLACALSGLVRLNAGATESVAFFDCVPPNTEFIPRLAHALVRRMQLNLAITAVHSYVDAGINHQIFAVHKANL